MTKFYNPKLVKQLGLDRKCICYQLPKYTKEELNEKQKDKKRRRSEN